MRLINCIFALSSGGPTLGVAWPPTIESNAKSKSNGTEAVAGGGAQASSIEPRGEQGSRVANFKYASINSIKRKRESVLEAKSATWADGSWEAAEGKPKMLPSLWECNDNDGHDILLYFLYCRLYLHICRLVGGTRRWHVGSWGFAKVRRGSSSTILLYLFLLHATAECIQWMMVFALSWHFLSQGAPWPMPTSFSGHETPFVIEID